MGLERVELVLDLEQRLGIQLPDDQTFNARTVADLVAAIIACEPTSTAPCPTMQTFVRLRRELMDRAGIPRDKIRPRTRLDKLFPAGKSKLWHKLAEYEPRLLGLTRLPHTEAAVFQEFWSLSALAFGVMASFNLLVVLLGDPYLLPYLTLPVLIVLTAVCYRRNNPTPPPPLQFPEGVQTVGELTRFLAPRRSASGAQPDTLAGRRMVVLNHVRASISAVTARPITSITEETELVRDLGM